MRCHPDCIANRSEIEFLAGHLFLFLLELFKLFPDSVRQQAPEVLGTGSTLIIFLTVFMGCWESIFPTAIKISLLFLEKNYERKRCNSVTVLSIPDFAYLTWTRLALVSILHNRNICFHRS